MHNIAKVLEESVQCSWSAYEEAHILEYYWDNDQFAEEQSDAEWAVSSMCV
jgi:hypothetical protein